VIKSIYATNFRRYSELSLSFDEDRQLILIAGNNGVGKSTILEVIMFALWGEGRNGRRNLDNLLKRGAELEGLSAQVVFTVGEDTYRVVRRRDGKNSTAVLYANDIPLMEGAVQVSSSIETLLGMDSTGFKLAVVAQQKDLDGLASLRPHERSQMVARLLRLDVLTAAKHSAQTLFKRERDIVKEIHGEDVSVINTEIAKCSTLLDSYALEMASAQKSLSSIDNFLLNKQDVKAQWSAAEVNVARLNGALSQLIQAGEDLTTQAEYLVLVDVPPSDLNMLDLAKDIAENERDLLVASAASATNRQHQLITEELSIIGKTRETTGDPTRPLTDLQVAELSTKVEDISSQVVQVTSELNLKKMLSIELNYEINSISSTLEKHANLEDTCTLCGQEVSVEYRTEMHEHLVNTKTGLSKDLAEASIVLSSLQKKIDNLLLDKQVLEQSLLKDAATRIAYLRITEEIKELDRRENMYKLQLSRLETKPVDIDAVYARKADIALQVAKLGEYDKAIKNRQEMMRTLHGIEEQIRLNKSTVASLQADLIASQPSPELIEQYQHISELESTRLQEADLCNYWSQEIAALQATKQAEMRRLVLAQSIEANRAQHQAKAVAAAAASRLLGVLSETLATRLRPNLEAAVSSILAVMSSSRFTAVKISDDYNITVSDQGKYMGLADLSGGEVDLVALSLRLALSQVVSERHGAGGAGFLILDECFASQDASRRQSILEGLRNMRDVYSQIFIVSHVENIEDSADMVIDVLTDEDRQDVEVLVS
jgi:DNA repair protein SbcC/Rad50